MLLMPVAIGVLLGFVGSIPALGPLLVLVVTRGLTADRRGALALAAGGAAAESGYVLLAFWGLSGLFARAPELVRAMQLSSAAILVVLGVLALAPRRASAARPSRAGGFVLGFSLVALNPAFALTWSAVAGAVYSLGLLEPRAGRAPWLALGAFAGIVLWFALVAAIAEKYRERFAPESLKNISRGAGILFIALAAWLVVRAFAS